jgi:hypothetical protein
VNHHDIPLYLHQSTRGINPIHNHISDLIHSEHVPIQWNLLSALNVPRQRSDKPFPPLAPIATFSPRPKIPLPSTIVLCTSVSNTSKKQDLQTCCPVLGRLTRALAERHS